MSGTHQFYTVTGRALPLPPKRTPSRHSNILRLPTCRAGQERSMTVRADSPGRIEVPRGGEFHSIPKCQLAGLQLVVYQEHNDKRKKTTEDHASTVDASTKASSVARCSRNTFPFNAATSGGTGPQTPRTPPVQRGGAAVSTGKEKRDDALNTNIDGEQRSTPATPRPASAQIISDSDSGSDSSSPCLNRIKPVETEGEYRWPARHCDAASAAESVPMSSIRQSDIPEERANLQKRGAVRPESSAAQCSVDSRSPVLGFSDRPHEQSAHNAQHKREAAQRGWQTPPPQQQQQIYNSSRRSSNNYCLDRSDMNRSNARRPYVNRHDHLYSQRKIEERCSSQSVAESQNTSYRPPTDSLALAHAPSPEAVKCSPRSLRSDEDPLEMNTPIADRVRQRSASSLTYPAAPAVTSYFVRTLEGTELMPYMPQLQGLKNSSKEEKDRAYCTIVRFIEYQPEAEREELEEMLQQFSGREDELCALLTEAYGEDFIMLRAACYHSSSTLLMAGHRKTPSVPASQHSYVGRNHTSRVLSLGDAVSHEDNRRIQRLPQRSQSTEAEDEYSDDYQVEQQLGTQSLEAEDSCSEGEALSQSSSRPQMEEGGFDAELVHERGYTRAVPVSAA
ncbi:hypothetical protein ABL78_6624 [Leptomonas seymouri]|uniref:Uncharacterized protein n=1 Tax=Leptomonas seymouri TaxID=5684 RepID=A0A0N1HV39_LEPSE|nr:hypothetical protein ABL78_6624 [Leptomonas seymouri]|eukprot:KPI84318.1 hypothetical protein ABL78_6624 [Leptomonas seymouri]